MRESITYRGEKIEIMGKGYLYDNMAWPNLKALHNYIDAKLDGGKANILTDDYFPKPEDAQ